MTASLSVLIGTTKGVFVLNSDERRETFAVEGPFCDGWCINHVIGDPASGHIFAAGGNGWDGAGMWMRAGNGAWSLVKLAHGEREDWIAANPEEAATYGMAAADPAPFSGEVDAIWSLARVGDALYAGAKPANLYRSDDDGRTWSRIDALANHPTRETWQPGAAGMTLHTILADPAEPAKLWVGISAAGVFASEDGGASWEQRIRRSNVGGNGAAGGDLLGGDGQAVGACVHNLARAKAGPAGGDLLYQQNHQGVFRSADGGRSWTNITAGLPSDFGFPIAVHPHDPQTVWVFPLNGDSVGRYPPDASAAVWRSRDGGESWEAMRSGLPEANCFFTVLRQAMAVDAAHRPGVYFGTNSGSVFASFDQGDSWREIARHLPTVLSVETMVRN
ncbi:MAG: exo-alpha-sialidase [Pseudomonadota bacterium]